MSKRPRPPCGRDDARLLEILYCGYQFAGLEFAQQIGEAFRTGEDVADNRHRLMSVLERALDAVEQHRDGVKFTLRLINDDGESHDLIFTDSPEEPAPGAAPAVAPRRPARYRSKARRKRPGKTRGKNKMRPKRRR
jgi:hypothetical protein